MSKPVVSVVLPVYNAEKFLAKSIESILNQSLKNFELIIFDDGSTDNSLKIIKKFKDKRIKVVSRENRGLAQTLNEAIDLSKGKYLARQDADDLSLPDRLKVQLEFMEQNLDVGLLGTNYHVIDGNDNIQRTTNVFTHPEDLKLAEFISNQFGHGSVMIRKSVLKKVGNYDTSLAFTEDYDLWIRISDSTKIANLKSVLYMWRNVGAGISTDSKNMPKLAKEEKRIRVNGLKNFKDNRSAYKLFAFHPTSTRDTVKKYLEMKSIVFRDLALLYFYAGKRKQAVPSLVLATLYAPWISKNYTHLLAFMSSREEVESIPYEYI